jgi:hypothetical protein
MWNVECEMLAVGYFVLSCLYRFGSVDSLDSFDSLDSEAKIVSAVAVNCGMKDEKDRDSERRIYNLIRILYDEEIEGDAFSGGEPVGYGDFCIS